MSFGKSFLINKWICLHIVKRTNESGHVQLYWCMHISHSVHRKEHLDEIEGFIMALQKQAVACNMYESRIYHLLVSCSCQLCHSHDKQFIILPVDVDFLFRFNTNDDMTRLQHLFIGILHVRNAGLRYVCSNW